MNDYQEDLFFKYAGLFIRMVEKRGIACLWSEDIYKSAGVEFWFHYLMNLAFVVPFGTKGCFVREDANTRTKITRKISSSAK